MLLVINAYQNEGEKRSAEISEEGAKDPNHIETFVKLLTVASRRVNSGVL